MIANEFSTHDLTKEEWREYEFGEDGYPYLLRVYRIESPQTLYLREGGTTHRVLDSKGIVHCVPAVGIAGCILRWKSRDPKEPVQF